MGEWPGEHVYRVNNAARVLDEPPQDLGELAKLRAVIEPWLTALVGSEHLSLLVGSGWTIAAASLVGASAPAMDLAAFTGQFADAVNDRASEAAAAAGRGNPNVEDQLRAALELLAGLRIMKSPLVDTWEHEISARLGAFVAEVLSAERAIADAAGTPGGDDAIATLSSFLGSFASRTGTRDRLHVFTTNYDRLIEFGLDRAGIWKLDRFLGGIAPVFRSSRLDLDLHYSPPGIRGEPRYLEGVVRMTKLHGSVDWVARGATVERVSVAFGGSLQSHSEVVGDSRNLLVYPNPAKDAETSEYPYAELFRDFASAIVRPNSVLVTYGYGFGDDHINRVIADMLIVPSTHLVALMYADTESRFLRFIERTGRPAQISYLIGSHLGDLQNLAQFYLPKPSVDRITAREVDLLKRRGLVAMNADDGPVDAEPAELDG